MMRRGDVVWLDLGTPIGAEAAGRRPVIVVSNDGANRAVKLLGTGVVTVVPITTNTARVQAFQVFLPGAACGLRADSKAQCEQVRSVDVRRLDERVGRIPPALVEEVDHALRLHLGL